MQLETARGFALPPVKRGLSRQVQQAGVFAPAFDFVVAPSQRLVAVVGDVAIKGLVLVVGHFGARTRPQRLGLVDHFGVQARLAFLGHAHRKGDVIRIAAHQRAQAPAVGELFGIFLEVQHDGGAAGRMI